MSPAPCDTTEGVGEPCWVLVVGSAGPAGLDCGDLSSKG